MCGVSRPGSPCLSYVGPGKALKLSRGACRARTLLRTGLQWLPGNHQAVPCTVTALLDRDVRKVPESG